MKVSPADVLTFLGQDVRAESEQLYLTIAMVTEMVRAYTRGNGFTNGEPDEPLAAVITASTARLVTNPTGERQKSVSVDDGNLTSSPGLFNGWTLPELAILHTYRRRAH